MEEKTNKTNNPKKFIISSIKLNKYKFFPGETIEGKLTIIPNKDFQGNDNNILKITNISFHLAQNIIYNVSTLNFMNNLEEQKENNKQTTIKKELINFEHLKGYEIKEILEIPFQFIIPPMDDNSSQNFMPSFRFISPKLKCFIFHILSIKIPGESNFLYIIIFIRKLPNKLLDDKDNKKDSNNNEELETHIHKENIVKICKLFKAGKLNYKIKINKSLKYQDENIPIEIHLDLTDLKKVSVKSINISFIKSLTFKKNSRIYKETISEKMISILKDKKDIIIKDYIQINKEDFPDLSAEEFQKEYNQIINECDALNNDKNLYQNKMKNNFTPPIENELFKFEYLLDIVFNLSTLTKDNNIIIPIDFYDGDYNNINLLFPDNNNKDNSNSINNENNIIDIDNKEVNENNEIQKLIKEDNYNDFVIINTKDIINNLDENKK